MKKNENEEKAKAKNQKDENKNSSKKSEQKEIHKLKEKIKKLEAERDELKESLLRNTGYLSDDEIRLFKRGY